ncbi:hypothetical protein V495_04198 [Pseudogymnoascus sp. VKM F-4514 (FW-929)]|nr:hypothetical protein V495_04198 [Pseudogymnoascus sp. VKM F-4514 (FW-929)]KFY63445.1 hypothetical protein V497_02019 [Pseudogymnoascus sp. VKM F-4516 (FW-969)]
MAVFSIGRFVEDPDTPRAIGQPRLSLATGQQDPSDAFITPFATIDARARVRESCKSPPTTSSVTSPTVLSRTNSSFSTASNSSRVSDASSVSTAPSLQSHNPSLNHQLLNMSINGSTLPCIFREILDCQHANFDDFDSWSEHIIDHFGPSGPPPYALCVFCDRSFTDDNPQTCWIEYLEHISEHIESDVIWDTQRPDFGVLRYLRDRRIISEEDYNFFCQGSERPRLEGLIPLDCEPEEITAKKRAEEAAMNRIIVSDPRRRRDQQRSPRRNKPSSTVIHSRNETS